MKPFWLSTSKSNAPNSIFYNSSLWKRIRLSIKKKLKFCSICKHFGRFTIGKIVDHICPIKQNGHATDENNLWLLCKSHDLDKQRLEKAISVPGVSYEGKIAGGEIGKKFVLSYFEGGRLKGFSGLVSNTRRLSTGDTVKNAVRGSKNSK